MKKKRNKYCNSTDIGAIGETDQGHFEVVSQDTSRWYTIRFLVTGHTKSVRRDYLVQGSMTDPYYPSKYGVGYLGEGPYKTTSDIVRDCGTKKKATPEYGRWNSMMGRCYQLANTEYLRYGALGVYVCEDWKNFQVFAKFFNDNWTEGLDLDKDILVYGNKCYSPETCVFVPKYINNLLVHSKNVLNGYPVGVYYLKQGPNMVNPLKKPFTSEIDKKNLGFYVTPMEAHKAWQEAKSDKIFESVNRYSGEKFFDTRVADALLSKAWKLKTDAQLGIETIRL